MQKHGLPAMRHVLLNIGVAFTSAVLCLALAEATLRFMSYWDNRKTSQAFQNLGQVEGLSDPTQNVPLRQMIRPSENPRIIYGLRPNISVLSHDKPVMTNTHGFRGPEYGTLKSDKTIRIVGLGDSVMFGWGVSNEEYYLALLSEYLNQSAPDGYRWEIINTAVPGYNTAMEVETFRTKGLDYHPDLVIIEYVSNDLDLPNFLWREENYLSLRKSFVLDFVLSRLSHGHRDVHNSLADAPMSAIGHRFESDPDRVPAQYKDLVGPDAYHAAMAELKLLSVKHDFPLLVFTFHMQDVVDDILRALDLPLLDGRYAFMTYMSELGIKKYGPPLALSHEDPHPSALGHAIVAKVLYDYLHDSGILSQIYQRRGITSTSPRQGFIHDLLAKEVQAVDDPPYLALTTDQPRYRRGDLLHTALDMANAARRVVDIYVILSRPDGRLCLWNGATFSAYLGRHWGPVQSGVELAQGGRVAGYPLQLGPLVDLPTGPYALFLVLTEADTRRVIARAQATFTLEP
jgi:GDSL-like Lipase/Acylhydrolase family